MLTGYSLKMAENFNINIEEALDEIAPYKTFTIKSNYKFGISNNTKEMMKKRDKTRANISTHSTFRFNFMWKFFCLTMTSQSLDKNS